MADEPKSESRPILGSVLDRLLDKSVAIAVMAIALWLGYTYHMKILADVIALAKANNEYLRETIDKKLDRILEEIARK